MFAGLMGLGMLAGAAASEKKLVLPPLIPWPGGRNAHSDKIIRSFPKHYDTFVEPFAGGASVFFRLPPVKTMVIGDANDWNIKFFDQVRRGGLRKCKSGVLVSRPNFAKSKKGKDACSKFAVSMISYQGNRETFGPLNRMGKHIGTTKMARLPDYEKKLRKTHMRIASFEETMKKFDSPTAVHFLDPPWPTDSGYEDRWYAGGKSNSKKITRKAFDPDYVMAEASKMKGFVYVVYGDHPRARAAFAKARKCGWKTRVETIRMSSQGNGQVPKKILVAIKQPGARACKALSTKKKGK